MVVKSCDCFVLGRGEVRNKPLHRSTEVERSQIMLSPSPLRDRLAGTTFSTLSIKHVLIKSTLDRVGKDSYEKCLNMACSKQHVRWWFSFRFSWVDHLFLALTSQWITVFFLSSCRQRRTRIPPKVARLTRWSLSRLGVGGKRQVDDLRWSQVGESPAIVARLTIIQRCANILEL